jgi:hypothetical protein
MNDLLKEFQQKLATLLFFYQDGPEDVEGDLIGELDDLWYRLSPRDRLIADEMSARIARGDSSRHQLFLDAFSNFNPLTTVTSVISRNDLGVSPTNVLNEWFTLIGTGGNLAQGRKIVETVNDYQLAWPSRVILETNEYALEAA